MFTPGKVPLKKVELKRSSRHKVDRAKKRHEMSSKKFATFASGETMQVDPSLAAFMEAKELFGVDAEVFMISVGTGTVRAKSGRVGDPFGFRHGLGEVGAGIVSVREAQHELILRKFLTEGENLFTFNVSLECEECYDASLLPYFRERASAWLRKFESTKWRLHALGRFCSKWADAIPETTSPQLTTEMPDVSL